MFFLKNISQINDSEMGLLGLSVWNIVRIFFLFKNLSVSSNFNYELVTHQFMEFPNLRAILEKDVIINNLCHQVLLFLTQDTVITKQARVGTPYRFIFVILIRNAF